jgi:hypothetical protein
VLADTRRFWIAGDAYPDGATLELLRAMAPHLDAPSAEKLQSEILNSTLIANDGAPAATRLRLARYEHLRRTRLLEAFPEHMRSSPARTHIAAMAVDAQGLEAPHATGLREVRSPMSAEQMLRASNEHILGLFEDLTDDTEWNHRDHARFLVGGSIQASRELRAFAKTAPERALEVIQALAPGRHERPVGEALEGLVDANYDPDRWTALVLATESRGFMSTEFRYSVASAIQALGPKLRDHRLADMLERWLPTGPQGEAEGSSCSETQVDGYYGAPRRVVPTKPDELPHAICEGGMRFSALPGGDYMTLRALEASLTGADDAGRERWLGILERYLLRPKTADGIVCWRALAPRFMRLRSLGQRFQSFLRELFEKYPEVLASEGGAHVLFGVVRSAPLTDRSTWIARLRQQGGDYARQLAGEFLTACDLWGAPVEDVLGRLAEPTVNDVEVLGILLFAAAAWRDESVRERATKVLCAGTGMGGNAVGAVLTAFAKSAVPADPNTSALLASALEHPNARERLPDRFLRRVDVLVNDAPELVVRVVDATLDAVHAGRRQLTFDIGPAFTAAAITLQRTEEFREVGLALFERLIRLRVYGVNELLVDLDRRPIG